MADIPFHLPFRSVSFGLIPFHVVSSWRLAPPISFPIWQLALSTLASSNGLICFAEGYHHHRTLVE